MDIEIIKKLNELNEEDVQKLFFSAFPDIKNIAYNKNISHSFVNDCLVIANKDLGYSLTVWDDYRVSVNSDIFTIKTVRLLNITNTLLEIGAIKLN
jgi:hypothetical protein